MFRPTLKIQINNNDSNVHMNKRELKDILREKITPSEILNTSLEIVDEINNISNNVNLEMENIDFIQNNIIAENLKPLVVHSRRQFDTGEQQQQLYYKSYIYDVSNIIVKIINYNCNPLSEYVIIKEIAAQKYARSLAVADKCNFETPNILKIGKIPISKLPESSQNIFEYNCIFFIAMNKLHYMTLKDYLINLKFDESNAEDCNNLSEEINNVIKCLENNHLYHNDLHEENIFVNANESQNQTNVQPPHIGILDYGNATEKSFRVTQPIYNCEMLKNVKNKRRPTSSPTTITEGVDTPIRKKAKLFGGKKYNKYYTHKLKKSRKFHKLKKSRKQRKEKK